MKEVFRCTEIIEAYNPSDLVSYHNWVARACNQYNSYIDVDGEVKISSLSPHYEHKRLIKETWDKESWEENEYKKNFKENIKDEYFITFRATYELTFFDEKCVFSDKSGELYKDSLIHYINHELGHDDYPEDCSTNVVTPKTPTQVKANLIFQWKLANGEGRFLLADEEPTDSELKKFKIDYAKNQKEEKQKNIESWK